MLEIVDRWKVLQLITDGCGFDVVNMTGMFLGDVVEEHKDVAVCRYLARRDQYRRQAEVPRPERWVNTTVRLAANMWGNKSASLAKRAHDVRIVFSKLWIGEVAAKADSALDGLCKLCGGFEDQKHILRECSNGEMSRVRGEWREAIVQDLKVRHMKKDVSSEVLEKLFHLAYSHVNGFSVFLGMFMPEVRYQLHEETCTRYTEQLEYARVCSGLKLYADAAAEIYQTRRLE